MQYLSCDICKKAISAPERGKNYYAMKKFHVCRKCKLTLDREMQDKAENETKPYDFITKKEEYWAVLEKRCSR